MQITLHKVYFTWEEIIPWNIVDNVQVLKQLDLNRKFFYNKI